MKAIYSSCVFALCLLSAACSAGTSASGGGTTASAASAPQAPVAAATDPAMQASSQPGAQGDSNTNGDATQDVPDLSPGNHEKELSYYAFRKYVLAKGWVPIQDRKCKENVVGGDYAARCAAHADGICGACQAIPELSSCGAGGVCLMRFHNTAKHLDVDVGTTGDVTDWKGDGQGSSLVVTGWAVSPAAAQ